MRDSYPAFDENASSTPHPSPLLSRLPDVSFQHVGLLFDDSNNEQTLKNALCDSDFRLYHCFTIRHWSFVIQSVNCGLASLDLHLNNTSVKTGLGTRA